MVAGPPPDRLQLAQPPDEPALEAAGVAPVAPPRSGWRSRRRSPGPRRRGDHVDRAWWWTGPAGGRPGGSRPGAGGERGHQGRPARARPARRPGPRRPGTSPGPPGPPPGPGAMATQVLAEPVVEGVEEAVAGHRALGHHALGHQGGVEDRPAGPTQQRAVEIDEDGAHEAEATAAGPGPGATAAAKPVPDAVKGSPGGWRSLHTDSSRNGGGVPVSSRSAVHCAGVARICQAALGDTSYRFKRDIRRTRQLAATQGTRRDRWR